MVASKSFQQLCFVLSDYTLAEQYAAAPLGGPYAIFLIFFMSSNIISFKQYFNSYD